eukprot:753712-Hanusia_phi.AAC.3
MAGRPRANSKAAAGVLLDIDNLLSPTSSSSDWSTGPLSVDFLLNVRRRSSVGAPEQIKPGKAKQVWERGPESKDCWNGKRQEAREESVSCAENARLSKLAEKGLNLTAGAEAWTKKHHQIVRSLHAQDVLSGTDHLHSSLDRTSGIRSAEEATAGDLH